MITVDTAVNTAIETVWKHWIDTESIKKWNHASDDWICPEATNNFKAGGQFSYTMSAKDGSASFSFEGRYTKIEQLKIIEFTLADNRKVSVEFEKVDDHNTIVTETFETEETNTVDKQREGWQAILNNFRILCEET